ncbi:heat-inducible transcriptional repressor HrcA [Candidatus Xianfuyuplasma coldseepsis]|uniref:Heat-inducible transcription repressor HrcA n=1 Tax=Candidatus Xianfuyuplasma coldseepsis TaxID=2782163 RepID=A0A7L7KU25_9MOLU|nr:heat-inducible transcriptional repressor HrcA [Xianfuyuplasma coldseepsis]QMS85919.1 heat-inducible transcription repressor HrcA [Xianfuyuplasma coldseepsis]
MLTERQEMVLKLIIEEYIKTAEPIGSRTLSKILEFSPATIRNEMADLEDLGYIEKTHTSSGRVPSDKGYHYYIEIILKDDASYDSSFNVIDELFENHAIKRDEAIKQAMNLLSQLTNYTTIALGTNAYGQKVKKIEMIPLYEQTCVLLIVTNFGHVESKQITIPQNTSLDDMKRVIEIFNEILFDCPINQVSEKLHYEINTERIKDIMSYNQTIIDTFLEAFTKFTQSKYYLSGKNKILYQPEFNDVQRVRELLTFFEQNDIFKLVENTEHQGLSVRIGKENQVRAMRDCTVITVPYQLSENDSGTIAIVGPTRMEYQKVIPLVKYLASHMSKLYKE